MGPSRTKPRARVAAPAGLVAVPWILACTVPHAPHAADTRIALSTPPCRACAVLRDAGALNAARRQPDSVETSLRLADFAVHGRPGDRITLSLFVDDDAIPALGTEQRLFARVGSRIGSYTLDELQRGVAVHTFTDARPVVQIEYSMNRRVPRPVAGALSLVQRVTGARVLRAHMPWTAHDPRTVRHRPLERRCAGGRASTDPACDVAIALPPHRESGVVPGAFQSGPDGAPSSPLTITLDPPTSVAHDTATGGLVFTTRTVTVTAWDADRAGHRMVARDAAGNVVGATVFAVDEFPGALTPDTRSITADEIATVELVPAEDDYVAYTMTVHVVRDTCRLFDDDDLRPEPPEIMSIYKRLAASSGWGAPLVERVERGGFIVERNGTIGFIDQAFREGAGPELCALLFDLDQINALRTRHLRGELRVIRQVHTHPADGDVLPNPGNCRRDTGREMALAGGDRLAFTRGPSADDLRPWAEGQVPWPGEVLTPSGLYRFERRSPMGGKPVQTQRRVYRGPDACVSAAS